MEEGRRKPVIRGAGVRGERRVQMEEGRRKPVIRGVWDLWARHLKTNWPGFVKDHRWLLLGVLIAAMLDGASTMWFMWHDGVDREVHPFVLMASALLGPLVGPVVAKVGQLGALLLVAVFLRRIAKYLLLVVMILYAWAAWYNVWGAEMYTPRLLDWMDWLMGY